MKHLEQLVDILTNSMEYFTQKEFISFAAELDYTPEQRFNFDFAEYEQMINNIK